MVTAIVPAMQAGAEARIDSGSTDEVGDCLDELIDVTIIVPESDLAATSSSSSCGGGSGGEIAPPPVDVTHDLSECVSGCDIREVPLLTADRVPIQIAETPPVYTVQCVGDSGGDGASFPLVSTTPDCPIPGLQTGDTTKQVPAQVIEERAPQDFNVDTLTTVTTGACLLDLQVSGPFGTSIFVEDQPVPCAHP